MTDVRAHARPAVLCVPPDSLRWPLLNGHRALDRDLDLALTEDREPMFP